MRQPLLILVLAAISLQPALVRSQEARDPVRAREPAPAAGELFEIRNYHYDPAQLDAYRQWATNHAIPFFREHMDVIGFWIGNEHPPSIGGTRPMDLALGSANVTWIIRWDSMAARETFHRDVYGGEQWRKVWGMHPDPQGYFQSEARFTRGY